MRSIQLTPLSQEEPAVLHGPYRTTKDVRLRTRAQMILLAAEHGMSAPAIAKIVHEHAQTVRNWFKRYEAEGAEGLKDAPRPGSPRKVTPEYWTQLAAVVRMRPRSLGLPYSIWTLARLADYMAEQTGIRVDAENVRVCLKEAEIRVHLDVWYPVPPTTGGDSDGHLTVCRSAEPPYGGARCDQPHGGRVAAVGPTL
jgi:transposase